MRMVDLIEYKKNNGEFNQQQIQFIIDGYVDGSIPDYQMSALLMAICFQGLTAKETAMLTQAMEYSGDIIDLSKIEGVKADKHSTGGVGDKTSLVLGPIVAACGGKVAKMSGRGLGHTGGTLDKLESIPGFNIYVSEEDFIKQVNDIGLAIIGQSATLVPADKKIYALRDVTGTVSCIPLIASSIMSKKLASGADTILLDVKYGNGAFMQTLEDAKKLAQTMIDIGKHCHKDTRATISSMSQPLGNAIGNSLEVIEAIETLKGKGPQDLEELCLKAGSTMLVQAKLYQDEKEAYKALQEVISNGKALEKLKEITQSLEIDFEYIEVTKNINRRMAMLEKSQENYNSKDKENKKWITEIGMCFEKENEAYLITTNPSGAMGMARPLRIKKVYGHQSMQNIIEDVYKLSFMHIGSIMKSRLPITTHYADLSSIYSHRDFMPKKIDTNILHFI